VSTSSQIYVCVDPSTKLFFSECQREPGDECCMCYDKRIAVPEKLIFELINELNFDGFGSKQSVKGKLKQLLKK